MTSLISRTELEAGLADGSITAVDALPESYYQQQHLPGAINVVVDDTEARTSELLPNKDAPIVTYCSDETCQNSGQVATKLQELGYTNVRKFAEGIRDWTQAGLPVEGGPASS